MFVFNKSLLWGQAVQAAGCIRGAISAGAREVRVQRLRTQGQDTPEVPDARTGRHRSTPNGGSWRPSQRASFLLGLRAYAGKGWVDLRRSAVILGERKNPAAGALTS